MEVPLPLRYKDVLLDCGYRIDLLISGDIIVEIKAVEAFCQSIRRKSSPTCG
jgi:GxxExxY protein